MIGEPVKTTYKNKREFIINIRNRLQVLLGDNDIELEAMAERLYADAAGYAQKKGLTLRLDEKETK